MIHNGEDRPVSATTHADKHDEDMVEAASDKDGRLGVLNQQPLSPCPSYNVPGKGAGLAGEYHLHKRELMAASRYIEDEVNSLGSVGMTQCTIHLTNHPNPRISELNASHQVGMRC